MGSTLPLTFWELVVQAAKERPDAPLVSDDHGRSLTRAQLRDESEATAAALSARGVTGNSVVSWQLPTTIEAVVLLVALARIGAVQNPLIPILREREVSFITQQVGTDLLIVPEEWRGFPHGAMARELAPSGDFDVVEIDLRDLGPGGSPHGLGLVQRLARTHGIHAGRCISNPLADHAYRGDVRPGHEYSGRRPPRPLRDLRPCGDTPPDGQLQAHRIGHSRPILPGLPRRARRERRSATFSRPAVWNLRWCPCPQRNTPRDEDDVRRAAHRQLGSHRVPECHVRDTGRLCGDPHDVGWPAGSRCLTVRAVDGARRNLRNGERGRTYPSFEVPNPFPDMSTRRSTRRRSIPRGGSIPGTSAQSTPPATSASRAASRTSSSAMQRTSPPSKLRKCSTVMPPLPRPPYSDYRTHARENGSSQLWCRRQGCEVRAQ